MQENTIQSTFYEIQVQKEEKETRSCLTFNINGHLFKFVYYFVEDDTGSNLNIVFNGKNNKNKYQNFNNLYDFEFYKCFLEEGRVEFPEPMLDSQFYQIPTLNLNVDRLENIQGTLNHITLHPKNKNGSCCEKNLQKINLRLNNNSKKKESTLDIERLSGEVDEPLTFFIKNSYLNGDNSKNFTLISLSRKFISEFENAFAFSRKITIKIPRNPSNSNKEHFESFKFHDLDNKIPEDEDFTLLVRKDLPGFEEIDGGDKGMNALIKKGYLNTLLEKTLDENKNGFVIVGNPRYCTENNKSIYVGFLN